MSAVPRPAIHDVLAAARKRLMEADVETPSLDARLLLQHVLQATHLQLIAEDTRRLSPDEQAAFATLLARRLNHEPVSKILGRRDFFGREFIVTKDVLDPRADTETLIMLCGDASGQRILDLGSGSGAIILTMLCEHATATGVAVDASLAALDITRRNAEALGVAARLLCLHSNWFEKVSGSFDLIVSNPPYIPTTEIDDLADDVKLHDPRMALDGGADGLEPYRIIACHSSRHLREAGRVVVEIGAGQADDVENIFKRNNFNMLRSARDLGSHIRALQFVHTG